MDIMPIQRTELQQKSMFDPIKKYTGEISVIIDFVTENKVNLCFVQHIKFDTII